MAAVVKVFDSHEGVGEGKKREPEAPGPEPAPAAAGARGTGGRRLGKCQGGMGPGGTRGAPAVDTRGVVSLPVSGIIKPLGGQRGRWERESATGGQEPGCCGPPGPCAAATGPAGGGGTVPARMLLLGPSGARSGPSFSRPWTRLCSRGGGEAPPVPFVPSFVPSLVPSAWVWSRGRC